MAKLKFQGAVTGDGFGYVYVMSYPGSDKVKIGHSLSPSVRATDIGGTLAPETPEIEAYFWCSERRENVERAAHRIESSSRFNGEWFKISVSQAIRSIEQAACEVNVEIQLVYERDKPEESNANGNPTTPKTDTNSAGNDELAHKIAEEEVLLREAIIASMLGPIPQPWSEAGVAEAKRRADLKKQAENIRLEKVRRWKLR